MFIPRRNKRESDQIANEVFRLNVIVTVHMDLRKWSSVDCYGTSILKRFVKDEAEDGRRNTETEYKLEASGNRRGSQWVGGIADGVVGGTCGWW